MDRIKLPFEQLVTDNSKLRDFLDRIISRQLSVGDMIDQAYALRSETEPKHNLDVAKAEASVEMYVALRDCAGALEAIHNEMPKHNCTSGCPDISKHVAQALAALAKADDPLISGIDTEKVYKDGLRRYVKTGEYRLPKAGEFFLSQPYDYVRSVNNDADAGWDRFILKEIK